MKLFSLKKHNLKSAPKHVSEVGEKAYRDWGVILAAFVFLILLVAFIDGYLLFRISRGDFFAGEPVSEINPESIKRKTLLDAQAFFAAREAEYQSFLSTTTPEIDPSI